jgi:hypothetical protein
MNKNNSCTNFFLALFEGKATYIFGLAYGYPALPDIRQGNLVSGRI